MTSLLHMHTRVTLVESGILPLAPDSVQELLWLGAFRSSSSSAWVFLLFWPGSGVRLRAQILSFKESSVAQDALRGERLWQERAGTEARQDETEDSSRLPGTVTKGNIRMQEKDKSLRLHRRTEGLSNIATGYWQDLAGGGGFDVVMGCRWAGSQQEVVGRSNSQQSSDTGAECWEPLSYLGQVFGEPDSVIISSFLLIFLKLAGRGSTLMSEL